jgi:DeoR/GlpR family transcriptional regulator of sugar metabolism
MLKKIKKFYLVVIELIITIALSMITEEIYNDVIVIRGHYTTKTWILVITTLMALISAFVINWMIIFRKEKRES